MHHHLSHAFCRILLLGTFTWMPHQGRDTNTTVFYASLPKLVRATNQAHHNEQHIRGSRTDRDNKRMVPPISQRAFTEMEAIQYGTETADQIKRPTAEFCSIPPELRNHIYEDVVAMVQDVTLNKGGEVLPHPLSNVCRMLRIESTPMFDAVETAKFQSASLVRAPIFNLDFQPMMHICSLPQLPNGIARKLKINITIDRPETCEDERRSMEHWLDRCIRRRPLRTTRRIREYCVRYVSRGCLAKEVVTGWPRYDMMHEGYKLRMAQTQGLEEAARH